jgi:hypothetical protein
MTDQVIKAAGSLEAACNTTPNTFTTSTQNGAPMTIRVTNISTGALVITVANAGVNVLSFTLLGNNVQYVTKYRGDTVVSTAVGAVNCLAVEVGRAS